MEEKEKRGEQRRTIASDHMALWSVKLAYLDAIDQYVSAKKNKKEKKKKEERKKERQKAKEQAKKRKETRTVSLPESCIPSPCLADLPACCLP